MRFVLLLGCCWVWARLGVFFGWPPAGLKGGPYGMAEVEGSGMLTAMFGWWGQGLRPGPSGYAFSSALQLQAQAAAAAMGLCFQERVLGEPSGMFGNGIFKSPQQGTSATATSCALVEGCARCLASPLPLRVQQLV